MNIKKLHKHPVINSFSLILKGNIAAQLVGLVTYSYIARVYSSGEIGIAALFMSVVTVLSMLQAGQVYWKMFSQDEKNRLSETYLDSISYNFLTTPFIIVFCLGIYLSPFNKLQGLILLVPVFSFFYNLLEINKTYFNATGDLGKTVKQTFFARSYGQLLKIFGSFVSKSSFVLIFSELLANCYVSIKEIQLSWKAVLENISFKLWGKYRRHILYYTPINFSVLLIQEIPVIVGAYIFELKFSGEFFLINRLVINPLTLIGNSFASSQVSKINSLNSKPKDKRSFLIKAYSLLILLGIVPSAFLYFFGEEIFIIAFGAVNKDGAGLVKLIAPLLFFKLIKSLTGIVSLNLDIHKELLLIKGLFLLSISSILFLENITFNFFVLYLFSIEAVFELLTALIVLRKIKV